MPCMPLPHTLWSCHTCNRHRSSQNSCCSLHCLRSVAQASCGSGCSSCASTCKRCSIACNCCGCSNARTVQVIKLISQVIADFANGEISQQQKLFDTSMTLEEYMDKNFYKTASLIAASCKSAAVFSGCSQTVKDSMFEYGRHLGLAFQIIDDILDFTQTAEQLGKPQVQTALCSRGSLPLHVSILLVSILPYLL